MIEAKRMRITGQQETLARISYQRFFRRYLRVAGMTVPPARWRASSGRFTACRWSRYRPTARYGGACPTRPTSLPRRSGRPCRHRCAVCRSRVVRTRRHPIGIRSEHLSGFFRRRLAHQVLNARQDQESRGDRQGGGEGRITVATNMAGRGYRHPACARLVELAAFTCSPPNARCQPDRPAAVWTLRTAGRSGSFQVVVSLEDEIVHEFFKGHALRLGRLLQRSGRPLPHWLGGLLATIAQRGAERHHGSARREMLRSTSS